jgi:sugar phosphate isomerase/epimerase
MNYVQFCDARAGRPADMQEMIRQARFDRLPPGEGALPLKDFLNEIPGQLPISLEVPMTRNLPPLERAKLVYESTVRVLG